MSSHNVILQSDTIDNNISPLITHPWVYNPHSNFTNINRIVVATATLSIGVNESWVFPGSL